MHKGFYGATGMSGEIGCLLMGLSVLPISSALRRSGAGRQQLSIGREPSPRETIRATHDGHHGYPLSLDDDTEQHRLLDHRIGGSDDEEAGVSSKQSTAPAGFVPESHSGEMSSTTMPNEPSKLEGAALRSPFKRLATTSESEMGCSGCQDVTAMHTQVAVLSKL